MKSGLASLRKQVASLRSKVRGKKKKKGGKKRYRKAAFLSVPVLALIGVGAYLLFGKKK